MQDAKPSGVSGCIPGGTGFQENLSNTCHDLVPPAIHAGSFVKPTKTASNAPPSAQKGPIIPNIYTHTHSAYRIGSLSERF